MPTMKCPICGNDIDDLEQKCPHCGYKNGLILDEDEKQIDDNKNLKFKPYEKKERSKEIWFLPICAVILIICIFIIIFFRNNADSAKQESKDTEESFDKEIKNDLEKNENIKSEEENNTTILQQKTYEIGNDSFAFSFGEKESGEYSLNLVCQIQEKYDAYITHISLNSLFNSDDETIRDFMSDLNFSYAIVIGDGTLLIRDKNFLSLANEEGVIDVNDYFSTEWVLSEESLESDYGTQVTNFLVDFIVGSENNEKDETENEAEETLIYSDDVISVKYIGISGSDTQYDINFIIENLSSTTITVQFRETSINGFMVDLVGSIEIAPYKKAKDGMTIWGDQVCK